MKVVSSQQMSYLESQAFKDGASESEFMEEAGTGIALVVHDYIELNNLSKHVLLLCGKGNNAGDAYVAGTHLLKLGYEVFALQLVPIPQCSPLCQGNHHRFLTEGGMHRDISSKQEVAFPTHGIVVDGIFGTGFKGKIEEPIASIIELANKSKLPIIAVDIPSGLNGSTGQAEGATIVAAETAYLELPKTGFFIRDGWNYVGKLRQVSFGLGEDYIEDVKPELFMIDDEFVRPNLPIVNRTRQKYTRGYVVGIAGSPGMSGSALLSSWSAINGGAGIVRLLHPPGMEVELSGSLFEIIKKAYSYDDLDEIVETLNKASAIYIGPGIGKSDKTRQMLEYILPKIEAPAVLDADALNILSEKMLPLPKKTVMTPHHGEMARLLGLKSLATITQETLKICQDYAEKHQITLILKGSTTFIFQKDKNVYVNSSGDPGMATAGSGDVLTGLVAAMIAQGLDLHTAACVSVYLHGLAGEHAAHELTSNCMLAGDIINHYPQAFKLELL